MKFNFKIIYFLCLSAVTIIGTQKSLRAEQNNCFRPHSGKMIFVACNHNCRRDPLARFNTAGRCSVCGHLVKKRPDFFIGFGVNQGLRFGSKHKNNYKGTHKIKNHRRK